MSLTKKRRVFIEEYLRCWNGAEAARRAGYKHPRNQASYLLTIPNIQEEIEQRIEELTMQADEVLLRLAEMARGEHGKYLNPDGTIDLGKLIEDGKQHLVKKVKPAKDGMEVEFYDAQKALVDVGRALGLFTDRLVVEGWRKAAEAKGLDSVEIFEHLVRETMAILVARDGTDDGGGGNSSNSKAGGTGETD